MSIISSTFQRAIIGLLFLLSVLVMQEFSIRLALPEFNPSKHLVFSWHVNGLSLGMPTTTQRQIKNTGDFNVEVQFNRYGLRDSEDVSLAESKDFLLVGDSFIFGWGVEEDKRLGEQLEKLITRQTYNAAIPGDLNTYELLAKYARQKSNSEPRTIIGLNMETDILPYQAISPGPKTTSATPKSSLHLQAIKEFLIKNSAIYFLITRQIHQTAWLRDIAVSLGLIQPNLQSRAARVPTSKAIELTVQRATEVASYLNATIVLIPSRYIWFGNRRQQLSKIHETIAGAIRANGIDMLDLKSVFEAEGHPLDYHFQNDGHWKPIGHAKAAEALAEHLKVRFNDAL